MLKYKERDGRVPNTLAFGYSITTFIAGLALFTTPLWPLGMLALAHALITAAYLLHECMHNTLFADKRNNKEIGAWLSWWLGAAYTPYSQLRDKHLRHHIQREDVLAFDAHTFMQRHRFLKKILRACSYTGVPAFEVYSHVMAVFAPYFIYAMRAYRIRMLLVLASRLAFFTLLFYIEPWAPIMYFGSWLLFLWVMNLMDSMQHSYEIRYDLMQAQQAPRFDDTYEQCNTFSNLLSQRHPWLNLLVLNFCYHNAHHHRAAEPWYRLPALHRSLYPAGCSQTISLATQLQRFHQFRLQRLQPTTVIDAGGVDGVSFLVGI